MISFSREAVRRVIDSGSFQEVSQNAIKELSDENVLILTMAVGTIGRDAPAEFTAGFMLALAFVNAEAEVQAEEAVLLAE